MTKITLNLCKKVIETRYGIEMTDTESYPQCYVWNNDAYSLKLYRLYTGGVRLFVMPLDDILADRFYDIRQIEDIYSALDQTGITVKQMNLFGAW